jgi:hypothetical protein
MNVKTQNRMISILSSLLALLLASCAVPLPKDFAPATALVTGSNDELRLFQSQLDKKLAKGGYDRRLVKCNSGCNTPPEETVAILDYTFARKYKNIYQVFGAAFNDVLDPTTALGTIDLNFFFGDPPACIAPCVRGWWCLDPTKCTKNANLTCPKCP